MATPEQHFQNGIKALERWKTNLHWPIIQTTGFKGAVRHARTPLRPIKLPEDSGPGLGRKLDFISDPEIPSLEQLAEQVERFSVKAILLGSCEDGVPLQLELNNPAPGALLIAGDPGSGKTRLLRSILNSVRLLNSPGDVSYCVIASDINEFTDLAEEDHCQSLRSTNEPGAASLIRDLSKELDARRAGQDGPAVILAIDNIAQLSVRIDRDVFALLYRIIKHGPRSGIWAIGTLSMVDINRIDQQLLDAFRTHLIGHISDSRIAGYVSRDPHANNASLVAGRQFSVPISGDWISFWICDSDGTEGASPIIDGEHQS